MQYLGKRPQRSGNEGATAGRKYTAALRSARGSAVSKRSSLWVWVGLAEKTTTPVHAAGT